MIAKARMTFSRVVWLIGCWLVLASHKQIRP